MIRIAAFVVMLAFAGSSLAADKSNGNGSLSLTLWGSGDTFSDNGPEEFSDNGPDERSSNPYDSSQRSNSGMFDHNIGTGGEAFETGGHLERQ